MNEAIEIMITHFNKNMECVKSHQDFLIDRTTDISIHDLQRRIVKYLTKYQINPDYIYTNLNKWLLECKEHYHELTEDEPVDPEPFSIGWDKHQEGYTQYELEYIRIFGENHE